MRSLFAGLVVVTLMSSGCSDRDGTAGPAAAAQPETVGMSTTAVDGRSGCRLMVPPLPVVGEVHGSGRGDFDGDRRVDTVTVYEPVDGFGGADSALGSSRPHRIRVEFGAGGVTDEELPDHGTVDEVVDVNGDGRDEVVVDIGGNTGLSVEFATVVACRIRVVLGPDGLPAGFGYYGHSTGYPGSVGTHCLDSDGDGRLDQVVQVASEPVGFPDANGDGFLSTMDYALAGPGAVAHYTWERQTYGLEDGNFRLLERTTGQYERLEGQLELSNDLVCESPTVPSPN